ncbi:hypothetical protein Tco_0519076 [Tanacetum coccineum]
MDNIADPLAKGLSRELVRESSKGMSFYEGKPNPVDWRSQDLGKYVRSDRTTALNVCTEEAHRQVDCDIVSKWIMKNSVESENMNCPPYECCKELYELYKKALEETITSKLERDSGRLLDCIGWTGLPIDRLDQINGQKNFMQASLDLKGLSELMNAYNEDYIAKDNKIKGLEDKNSWYETQLNRKHIHLEERKKDYYKVKKDNEQMKEHKNEMDRTKKDNLNDMDNIKKKAHANEMDLVLLKRNASNAELEQLVAQSKEAHRRLYEMVIEELLKEASNNKETGKAVELRVRCG